MTRPLLWSAFATLALAGVTLAQAPTPAPGFREVELSRQRSPLAWTVRIRFDGRAVLLRPGQPDRSFILPPVVIQVLDQSVQAARLGSLPASLSDPDRSITGEAFELRVRSAKPSLRGQVRGAWYRLGAHSTRLYSLYYELESTAMRQFWGSANPQAGQVVSDGDGCALQIQGQRYQVANDATRRALLPLVGQSIGFFGTTQGGFVTVQGLMFPQHTPLQGVVLASSGPLPVLPGPAAVRLRALDDPEETPEVAGPLQRLLEGAGGATVRGAGYSFKEFQWRLGTVVFTVLQGRARRDAVLHQPGVGDVSVAAGTPLEATRTDPAGLRAWVRGPQGEGWIPVADLDLDHSAPPVVSAGSGAGGGGGLVGGVTPPQ